MSKIYSVTLEQGVDEDDLILPLPDGLMEELGWKIDDTLKFDMNDDGSIVMSKVEPVFETEYVMVETIQTFRHRYVVEVPKKGKTEWALDTVACDEAIEFSQKHLGEQIVSHRVVSKDEVLAICDKDNDYTLCWSDDKKMEVFVTPWNNSK